MSERLVSNPDVSEDDFTALRVNDGNPNAVVDMGTNGGLGILDVTNIGKGNL